MSLLVSGVKKLLRLAARLAGTEGRRFARRHARLKFYGQLRAVRASLDAEYPVIEKPKPPPAPRREHVRFNRRFDMDHVRLFVRIAADLGGHEAPHVHVCDGYRADVCDGYYDRALMHVYKGDSHSQRWKRVVHNLAHMGFPTRHNPAFKARETALKRLWHRFYREPVETADLHLAAEHARFLECVAKRRRYRKPDWL